VFRAADGGPLNGSWVHHRFQSAANEAGLPVIRFHDLRHSAASLLGAMGVPLLVVSQILGHSSVKLTADTYSHVFAPALRDAAAAMEAVLG